MSVIKKQVKSFEIARFLPDGDIPGAASCFETQGPCNKKHNHHSHDDVCAGPSGFERVVGSDEFIWKRIDALLLLQHGAGQQAGRIRDWTSQRTHACGWVGVRVMGVDHEM